MSELNKAGDGTKPYKYVGHVNPSVLQAGVGRHMVGDKVAVIGDVQHLTDAQAFALKDRFVPVSGGPAVDVPSGGPTGTGGKPTQAGQPAGGVTNPTPGGTAGTTGNSPQAAPAPPAPPAK